MSTPTTPYREIRAHYTEDTITVYQAYSTEIGAAAVEHQRLDASPKFSTTRMTWIKPSWAWMLYRSGYSYKDPRQECILALSVKKEVFIELLERAVVASSHSIPGVEVEDTSASPRVRVQWDPERTIRLEKLPYRSIQIGIPGALVNVLIEGTVNIQNVTERARQLKEELDNTTHVNIMDMHNKGLVLEERAFVVNDHVRHLLRIDEHESS